MINRRRFVTSAGALLAGSLAAQPRDLLGFDNQSAEVSIDPASKDQFAA